MNENIIFPLYWNSPYQREILAKITAVKGNEIQFDQSLFYPGGGGQLSDNGYLNLNDKEYQIIETHKKEDGIWLKVDLENVADFELNKNVLLKLNWDRRYAFMKAHSAQHLISHLLKEEHNCETEKANFEENRMEIIISKKLSLEEILKILEKANDLIYKGVEVKSIIVDNETYLKDYLSKTRGKKSQEKIVRLIQLGEEGFDFVCCGGTHVNNLSEIKGIFLESIKEQTIKLYVERDGLLIANQQRKLMIELENITTKKGKKLLEMVKNKLLENEVLQEGSVSLMKILFKNIKPLSEDINGHSVAFLTLLEINRLIIQSSVKELCEDVFVVIHARDEILYLLSSDKEIDADKVAKLLIEKLDKKGGGNKGFAQLSVKDVEEPLKLVREVLSSI